MNWHRLCYFHFLIIFAFEKIYLFHCLGLFRGSEAPPTTEISTSFKMWMTPARHPKQTNFYLFVGFCAAGLVLEAWKWPRHARRSVLRSWQPLWTHFEAFSPIWSHAVNLRLGPCPTWQTWYTCCGIAYPIWQMLSTVETGQMSAAETRLMFLLRNNKC